MYRIIIRTKGSRNLEKIVENDFRTLKKRAIEILDNRGWDNKNRVDFRSLKSVVEYIFPDKDIFIYRMKIK